MLNWQWYDNIPKLSIDSLDVTISQEMNTQMRGGFWESKIFEYISGSKMGPQNQRVSIWIM